MTTLPVADHDDAVAWVTRPAVLPAADVARLVVEASAGTGKTFFLEHRVIDLMLGAGAELDQILLVTFTEKATAELRTRIRGLLDRLVHAAPGPEPTAPAWRIDSATRIRLRAALWSFERAAIFTIHGFCQRVLVEETLAGRRLFDQAQVAEDVAFDDAWRALLREQFARDPRDAELLSAYLSSGKSLDQLRDLLAYAIKTGVPIRPAPRTDMPLAQVERLRAAVLAIDDVDAGVQAAGGRKGSIGTATRALRLLQRRLTAAPSLEAAVLAVDALMEHDDSPSSLPGALRPTKGNITPPVIATLLAALDETLPLLQRLSVAIAHQFVPALRARLEHDKATRGQFDYQDLLARVAELLRGDRGDEVAARLRARMPWAMIDEFQDTDPLQWEIFERIWGHPDARGLVIVGDPKQAIYSFRGADVQTYLRARQALQASGAVRLDLAANYRSSAALVAATNTLLRGPGPGAGYFTGAIDYDTPVTAGSTIAELTPTPPITVWTLAGDDKPSADAVHATLINRMAAEIIALTRGPTPLQFRTGPDAAIQTLNPGHIYVLTRSNRESDAVAIGLRRHGIACALLMAEYLMVTPEAQDVADVLDAIAHPRDPAMRMRAWRTAFFAVPWHELQDVADAPDHHPLVTPLLAWAELARRREFHRLFHQIITDSNFAARALAIGRGERAIVNTRQVLEALQIELEQTPSDLIELGRRLRAWIAAGEEGRADDSDVQRAETDAPAVTIMTTHRAKGLEAPVVFLYGGVRGFPGRDPMITVHDATTGARVNYADGNDRAKSERAREVGYEDERLGYVALTRAKLRTYLPSYPGTVNGAYAPIQRALDGLRTLAPAGLRWDDVPLRAPVVASADAAAALAAAVLPAPTVWPVAPTWAPEQAGGEVQSYSRLAHASDDASGRRGVGGADEPDVPRIELPAHELPAGADSGLCVHQVLELVDVRTLAAAASAQAWAALPAVAAILDDAMARHRVPARARAHTASIVYATLTTPPTFGPHWDGPALTSLASATRLAREVEFTYPRSNAADGVVRGYLDAIAVWDDQLWIVDYKSDVVATRDHAGAQALVDERYPVQAVIYGLAGDRLARAPLQFAGLLYWFVRDQLVIPVRATPERRGQWASWLATLPRQDSNR